MVFQHFNLFPHMTALENVTAGPLIVKGADRRAAESEGRALLAKVEARRQGRDLPSHLSGGRGRQRSRDRPGARHGARR